MIISHLWHCCRRRLVRAKVRPVLLIELFGIPYIIVAMERQVLHHGAEFALADDGLRHSNGPSFSLLFGAFAAQWVPAFFIVAEPSVIPETKTDLPFIFPRIAPGGAHPIASPSLIA